VFETGKSDDTLGNSCFTLWLRPFTDPQNRRHLLKTGASPAGLPDLLRDPPAASLQPYSVVNLGSVFKMMDEDLRRSLLEELPGAPGTPHGIVEYGDALTVQTPQATAAATQIASGIPALMVPGKPAPAVQAQPTPLPTVAPSLGAATTAAGPTAAPAGVSALAAPVAPAPIPAPPSVGSAPVAAAAPAVNGGANGGPAIMVAQPRKRKGATSTTPTAPAPIAPMAVVDPPQTAPAAAVAQAPLGVGTTAGTPIVPGAVAVSSGAPAPLMTPTSGTSAPPPPGMRPPMKVPGS
jgi:hypothetical protein